MRPLIILTLLSSAAFAAHDGTVVGSPTFAAGKFSNAMSGMNGSTYIAVPTGTFNWSPTADWTVEAWLKTPATGLYVATGSGTVADTKAFWMGLNGSTFAASVTGTGAFAGGPPLDSGVTINDDTWHHCAAVMSGGGTTLKVFVDGVLSGTFTGVTSTPASDHTSGGIGTFIEQTAMFAWPGAMDEVAIWSIAKYSGNFTPPTAPYGGGESGMYALYHLDADGTDSVVASPTLSGSPNSLQISTTGNSIALTGVGTAWSAGTPGTPTFSLSGGTGASITAQTVASATTATITVSAGSASGTLTITDPSTSATFPISVSSAIYADDANIVYTGRWGISGSGASSRAKTITTGAYFDVAISGASAVSLLFDETGLNASGYPDIEYQVDGGPPTRTTLSTGAGMTVTVSFPVASMSVHRLRVWAEGITEGSNPAFNLWTSLAGVVSFRSILVTNGAVTLPIAVSKNSIEFFGDSLTATIRQLSDCGGGSSSNATCMAGHNGWPAQVGAYLGMRAIPVGFGGTGLTVAGSGSVPAANTTFPLVYAGTSYSPAYPPQAVVVSYGTNDGGASSGTYQSALTTYLATIRAAYPSAYIFCAGLPSNTHAADMSAVVAAAGGRLYYLDYTALSLTTTDGTHFDTAGASKLAASVAHDIQARFNTAGVVLGVPGVGAAAITAQ